MAILVNFSVSDSAASFRYPDSGDGHSQLPESKSSGEVGFKFGIMPEQAMDALIGSAARLAQMEPFRFELCVSGRIAKDDESFHGTVSGQFVELFADFPDSLVPDLSSQWTNNLGPLHDSEFPATVCRKRTWLNRFGSAVQSVVFRAVMFPILAICHLSPSFRRERLMNKKKLAERKTASPSSNEELISSLIRVCRIARERGEPVVYTWNL